MVTATLAETVIGTGAAWLYWHDAEPALMWVVTAEVDAAYAEAGRRTSASRWLAWQHRSPFRHQAGAAMFPLRTIFLLTNSWMPIAPSSRP